MAIEFYAVATNQFVDINNDAPMAFKFHRFRNSNGLGEPVKLKTDT